MPQGQFLQHESTALVASAAVYQGPFQLSQLSGFNNSESVVYVQVHDSTLEPVNGATPRYAMRVPASGSYLWQPALEGRRFFAGCWVCSSSTPDTLTITAPAIWVDAEGLQLGPASELPPDSYPMMRWFGPTLTPGPVASWVDTGPQMVDMVNEFEPTQPTAAVGLNGLVTLQSQGSTPLYGEFDETGTRSVAIAFVVTSPAGAECLYAFMGSLEDDSGLSVQYSTEDGPQLAAIFTDPDGEGEQINIGDGEEWIGIVWWDPASGDYRISFRVDGGPVQLLEGSVAAIAPISFGFGGLSASIPYEPEATTQTAEIRFYAKDAAMSASEQSAIIASLASVWWP